VQSSGSSFRQDFHGLESALLNGDTSGAQSALSSLQQTIGAAQGAGNPSPVLSQLGNPSSPPGQDLKAVADALNANDIGSAQKAFARLQQDLQAAREAAGSQPHRGHHAHHARGGANAADGASGATPLAASLQSATNAGTATSTSTDLLDELQSLASANPVIAKDLEALVTDLKNSGNLVNTRA